MTKIFHLCPTFQDWHPELHSQGELAWNVCHSSCASFGNLAASPLFTVFKEDPYGELTFYLIALTLAFPNSDFLAKVFVPECSLSVWLSPGHRSARWPYLLFVISWNEHSPVGRVPEVLLPMLCCTRIKPSWYGQNSENQLPGDRPLSKLVLLSQPLCASISPPSHRWASLYLCLPSLPAICLCVRRCDVLPFSVASFIFHKPRKLTQRFLEARMQGGWEKTLCFQTRENLKQLVALTE